MFLKQKFKISIFGISIKYSLDYCTTNLVFINQNFHVTKAFFKLRPHYLKKGQNGSK
jgi:hypothetical protein